MFDLAQVALIAIFLVLYLFSLLYNKFTICARKDFEYSYVEEMVKQSGVYFS